MGNAGTLPWAVHTQSGDMETTSRWRRMCGVGFKVSDALGLLSGPLLKATQWQRQGFPGSSSGKESAYRCWRCKRHRFDSWVGKIPRKRKMATPSRILVWKFPLTRGAWRVIVRGLQKVVHDWAHSGRVRGSACSNLGAGGLAKWRSLKIFTLGRLEGIFSNEHIRISRGSFCRVHKLILKSQCIIHSPFCLFSSYLPAIFFPLKNLSGLQKWYTCAAALYFLVTAIIGDPSRHSVPVALNWASI